MARLLELAAELGNTVHHFILGAKKTLVPLENWCNAQLQPWFIQLSA
jgi:hypothetical protein